MKLRFSTQIKRGSFDLGLHRPVRAASTADIDLATGGLLTVDGVALAADERVLVKDQTVGSENGIYVAKASSWIRAEDFDEGAELVSGAVVAVQEGTVNGDTIFILATDGAITLGTTALAFIRTSINSSDVLFKSKYISNEVPAGAVNGANTTFTLANVPDVIMSVTLNGIDQLDGTDYTIAGSTITMLEAPKGSPGNPDIVLVSYFRQ